MAVGLHVVARLQEELALAVYGCPEQAAGKGAFEGAVADGAAGIGICGAEGLDVVVGVGGGDVVCADVLSSFDGC